MKVISEYYGEDTKHSLVYNYNNKYFVSLRENSVVKHVSEHDLLDEAEDCAEEWVMKNE